MPQLERAQLAWLTRGGQGRLDLTAQLATRAARECADERASCFTARRTFNAFAVACLRFDFDAVLAKLRLEELLLVPHAPLHCHLLRPLFLDVRLRDHEKAKRGRKERKKRA